MGILSGKKVLIYTFLLIIVGFFVDIAALHPPDSKDIMRKVIMG